MGVTIHFEGKLRSDISLDELLETAKTFCDQRSWQYSPISEANTKLCRVRDEREWNYEGPVTGLEIFPHTDCEPLRLEFDSSLYVQEYTKTQFAPIGIHVHIVELLKQLMPKFEALTVFDEGEYFETDDLDILSEHRRCCDEVIQQYLSQPGNKGPVRGESGRIVDVQLGKSL